MILELLTTLREQRLDNRQLRDRLDQLLRRLYVSARRRTSGLAGGAGQPR
jgi:hypothetical protein